MTVLTVSEYLEYMKGDPEITVQSFTEFFETHPDVNALMARGRRIKNEDGTCTIEAIKILRGST